MSDEAREGENDAETAGNQVAESHVLIWATESVHVGKYDPLIPSPMLRIVVVHDQYVVLAWL